MNRALRYGVALIVGLSATGFVVRFSSGNPSVTVAIFALYAATTSLVVANWGTWRTLSRPEADRRGRYLGAMGGGISGGTTIAVGQLSLAAAVAALGLMMFGMALTIAELDRVCESSPV